MERYAHELTGLALPNKIFAPSENVNWKFRHQLQVTGWQVLQPEVGVGGVNWWIDRAV